MYRSPRYRRSWFDSLFTVPGFIVAAVLFFGVIFGVGYVFNKSTEKMVTFTVEDKERVNDCTGGDCTSKYLIFTDQGVFENTDSVTYGKFRSSDLYGRLKEGQTYTCKTTGWRIGLFSMYPNIISCQ